MVSLFSFLRCLDRDLQMVDIAWHLHCFWTDKNGPSQFSVGVHGVMQLHLRISDVLHYDTWCATGPAPGKLLQSVWPLLLNPGKLPQEQVALWVHKWYHEFICISSLDSCSLGF